MKAPALTAHEADIITNALQAAQRDGHGFNRDAALTLAQAIERINHLRPIVMAARDDAFQKCRPFGLTALAQVLLLHDDGVFTAEQTIKSMRETLGIPVTPESRELGQLQAAFYQGHFHGKASAPTVGGHYEDL